MIDAPDASQPRPRPRIPSALARVAALGALGGFVLGSLILGLLQHGSPGGWSWVDVPFSMMFGGTFGAVVGAVAAPVAGWFLFRHVPLGRAMAVTALGTLLGAALGWGGARSPVLGGCVGFFVAAVLLRLSRRLTSRYT
jgi:hypothetical protein